MRYDTASFAATAKAGEILGFGLSLFLMKMRNAILDALRNEKLVLGKNVLGLWVVVIAEPINVATSLILSLIVSSTVSTTFYSSEAS